MRRTFVALMATLALVVGGLSTATAASASGTTFARFNTGYPNTYAKIVWSTGDSIHTNGTKRLSASCNIGCGEGWAEMVMQSGDVYRLWVSSGQAAPHKDFYSPVNRFRFCILDLRCTDWKTS